MFLPHEVLDHILDYLHDDFETLGACALASRALLQTSRHHRFNECEVGLRRMRELLPLLGASRDLANSIMALKMVPRIVPAELLDSLQHLPALRALRTSVDSLPAAAHVPRLTSLHVQGHQRIRGEELLRGISMFPQLEQLILDGVFLKAEEGSAIPFHPPAPPLHRLHCSNGDCAAVVWKWLAAEDAIPTHISLMYTIRHRMSAARFAESCGPLAPLAQDLEIRFIPDGNMDGALHGVDFDLSSFTSLRSCTLRFASYEMCVPQNLSLTWIPRILAQLRSEDLRSLTISLVVDNVEDLRSLNSECAVRVLTCAYFDDMCVLDWASIGNALLSESLAGLKTVAIEGQHTWGPLKTYIRASCPEMHSRGILSLVPVGPIPRWV
ncbi:hypothetical protein C8Q80DRAFT_867664 [Daedaleopsis nitida]|nr:hypothetical protein C8Q80DRAFT_867664 [Daedaleopsis nitida]